VTPPRNARQTRLLTAAALVAIAAVVLGWWAWPRPTSATVLHTGTAHFVIAVTADYPRLGTCDVEIALTARGSGGGPTPDRRRTDSGGHAADGLLPPNRWTASPITEGKQPLSRRWTAADGHRSVGVVGGDQLFPAEPDYVMFAVLGQRLTKTHPYGRTPMDIPVVRVPSGRVRERTPHVDAVIAGPAGAYAVLLGGRDQHRWTQLGTSSGHRDVGPDTPFSRFHIWSSTPGARWPESPASRSCCSVRPCNAPAVRCRRGMGGTPVRVFGGVFTAPLGLPCVPGSARRLSSSTGLLDLVWHSIYGFDAVAEHAVACGAVSVDLDNDDRHGDRFSPARASSAGAVSAWCSRSRS